MAITPIAEHAAPGTDGWRRRAEVLRFGLTTAAAVGALVTLAAVDPHEPGHYPTCPFLAVTGHYCPGCGSLRALNSLLSGDIGAALDRNPLAVVLIPLVGASWVMWGLRLLGAASWTPTHLSTRWVWTLLVVVLLFWLLRNLPGATWLSPA